MTMLRRRSFRAIDLFCGCGGLTLGLRRAGFKIVAAVDNDPLSVATYKQNNPKYTRVVEDDITKVDAEALMATLRLQPGDLDLLAGCPPCQGFSTLRTLNGSRRIVEPLNDLVFQFIRFVEIFRPKALMMENVPALLNDWRLARIRKNLDDLRYEHDAKLLDAVKFGVPQRRCRMILLGVQERYGPPSFAPSVRGRRTVAGVLQRLPSPKASTDSAHNYLTRRADHVLSMIRRIPKDGGSRTDLLPEEQLRCHQNFRGFSDIYGRMAWRAPAPTITSGCINPSKGRFLHPEEDRPITLREAALLQGFPASYKFDLSKGRGSAAMLIGNAFPPKFAEHHARSLRWQIGGISTAAR